MIQRALITGANGFVGRHLQDELQRHGWTTYGLGRTPTASKIANYISCDISEADHLTQIVRDIMPDVVFHLAAVTPVVTSSAEAFYRVNVLGTLNVLTAVQQHAPLATVILVTSSAIYGRALVNNALIDEASPLLPVNAYGVSKATQHLLGYQYAVQFNLRVIRVCPFNLIGPGLPRGLVASDFAYQLMRIEAGLQTPILMVGDLNASRDFLDVRDAVCAFRVLAERGESGASYNVASERSLSIRELLDKLIEFVGVLVTVKVREGVALQNPIPSQIGSNRKLFAATGWRSRLTLDESIRDIIADWRVRVHEGE